MDGKEEIEQFQRLASLEANVKNIKEIILDLRDNHIQSIYGKIDDQWKAISDFKDLVYKRPPWFVVIIITALFSLSVGLIVKMVVSV